MQRASPAGKDSKGRPAYQGRTTQPAVLCHCPSGGNGPPPGALVALLPQRFPERQRHAAAEDGTRRSGEGLSGMRRPLWRLYGLRLPRLVTPASKSSAAGEYCASVTSR
ncbi:hypothetical protein MTO96_025878 [Rhipicephalus appendiculatus]